MAPKHLSGPLAVAGSMGFELCVSKIIKVSTKRCSKAAARNSTTHNRHVEMSHWACLMLFAVLILNYSGAISFGGWAEDVTAIVAMLIRSLLAVCEGYI